MRFPVYVLVTKCDLLAGFTEYFGDLSQDERAQVWGVTVPLDADGQPRAERRRAFRAEFDAAHEAPRGRACSTRMQQRARRRSARGRIYAFPQQFAALRDAARATSSTTLFTRLAFASTPLVRGVYFTSGTQEGTPIDRVLRRDPAHVRRVGVGAERHRGARDGRSYFLRNLLQKVVFAEWQLVERNPAKERRRRLVQAIGVAVCLVLLAGALAAWSISYVDNRNYLADVTPRARELAQEVQATPNTTSDDLATLLPILDEARDLAGSSHFNVMAPPVSYEFGLYQGKRSSPSPTVRTTACSRTSCCRASRCASSGCCARRRPTTSRRPTGGSRRT